MKRRLTARNGIRREPRQVPRQVLSARRRNSNPCNISVTRRFPARLYLILIPSGSSLGVTGNIKAPCNRNATRVLQVLYSNTDGLGKEYRLPREGILTPPGSQTSRAGSFFVNSMQMSPDFSCKTQYLSLRQYRSHAKKRASGRSPNNTDGLGKEYRLPREGIPTPSGRNTDSLGIVLLTASGRNTDSLGKFRLQISCKIGFFVSKFCSLCMYVCMFCLCCLTQKRKRSGGHFG